MARTILVSASDTKFFHLLEDLLASVEDGAKRDGHALGVLDVGLTDDQRAALEQRGVIVLRPELDYAPELFKTPPELTFRAQAARPNLPRYFPGYDLYLFMDADCWVQDWETVRLYLRSAQAVGLAVTPECHRSYNPIYDGASVAEWRYHSFSKCFEPATAKTLALFDLINSGVFAARADGRLWEAWANVLGNIVGRLGEAYFFAEQNALNAIIRGRVVPAALLPAHCNWVCNRVNPMTRDNGAVLCEPAPPYTKLGIVHLTGPGKEQLLELSDISGTRHTRTRRYPRTGGA
jgi:hypothetical protein